MLGTCAILTGRKESWRTLVERQESWLSTALIQFWDLRLDELSSVQIGKGPRESKMNVKENGSVEKREIDMEESQKENQSIMG